MAPTAQRQCQFGVFRRSAGTSRYGGQIDCQWQQQRDQYSSQYSDSYSEPYQQQYPSEYLRPHQALYEEQNAHGYPSQEGYRQKFKQQYQESCRMASRLAYQKQYHASYPQQYQSQFQEQYPKQYRERFMGQYRGQHQRLTQSRSHAFDRDRRMQLRSQIHLWPPTRQYGGVGPSNFSCNPVGFPTCGNKMVPANNHPGCCRTQRCRSCERSEPRRAGNGATCRHRSDSRSPSSNRSRSKLRRGQSVASVCNESSCRHHNPCRSSQRDPDYDRTPQPRSARPSNSRDASCQYSESLENTHMPPDSLSRPRCGSYSEAQQKPRSALRAPLRCEPDCFGSPEQKCSKQPPAQHQFPPSSCCGSCFSQQEKQRSRQNSPKPIQPQQKARDESCSRRRYESYEAPSEPRRKSNIEHRKQSRSDPFCEPCYDPYQEDKSAGCWQPRSEHRSEHRHVPKNEAPPKASKQPRPRCEGCYEPRPQPEVPRSKSECSCGCKTCPVTDSMYSCCLPEKPSDYVEHKLFTPMAHRNPLVVRSQGCLSECPTQGFVQKTEKSKKPRQQSNYDTHGFQQQTCPANQGRQSQKYYGQSMGNSSADYAELQNRSGRYVKNPLTVSSCSCNVQPSSMSLGHTKRVKERKATPYSSYQTFDEAPVQSPCPCDKPAPRKEVDRRHTSFYLDDSKEMPHRCTGNGLPALNCQNPRMNFVPAMWFNASNLPGKTPINFSNEGSYSGLSPMTSSSMQKCRRQVTARSSHRGTAHQGNLQLAKHRGSLPKRRLSGCGTSHINKKCLSLHIKNRRCCPSKLFTSSGSNKKLPLVTISNLLKTRRMPKANPCALRFPIKVHRVPDCTGVKIKQHKQRCRGGKLSQAGKSPQSARNANSRPREKQMGGTRAMPASSPKPSRLQTTVRNDRAQGQSQSQTPARLTQETGYSREQHSQAAIRPKPLAAPRRDLPQRYQMQAPDQPVSRPIQVTENIPASGGTRASRQPARNAPPPAGGTQPMIRLESTGVPVERREIAPIKNQNQSRAPERTEERAREQVQERVQVRAQERKQEEAQHKAEERIQDRAQEREAPRSEENTLQRARRKSSEKQITTQRPQYLRDGQVQQLPEPVIHSHSRDGCMGTNIHHFYRGSFLAVRSTQVTDEGPSDVPAGSRRRGSLLTVATNIMRPRIMNKSAAKCSAFVVPNKWQCMQQLNGLVGGSAIVELQKVKGLHISSKSGWSWRKVLPSWLVNGKAKATSA
ncbi:serine/arginine repetitive matrix protein 1 [Drosophila montana]|uniref:serine/arginine repetitive matrix protein 1 n=1 Tax=Drosophila montana TaxID=40370 RepID=UPI00313F1438